MRRRVLVTGGAGFIGVPLVQELQSRDLEVAVLDDFSVGSAERVPAGVHVVQADLREREATRAALEEWEPETVVHLAALHFIPDCVARPAETLARNVTGTQNLLDAAAHARVRRILLASTGDVYAPAERPHAETDPTVPGNVYGASKLMAEWLLGFHLAAHPGCSGTVLRLFNTYGPGETNPHVIPEILGQLRAGDVLRLGNVESRRDYVFVRDVVQVAAELLQLEEPPAMVNVGSGQAWSVAELVDALRRITGRALEISVDEARLRPSDRPFMAADTTRLRALLPRFAPTAIEAGLERTARAEGLLA